MSHFNVACWVSKVSVYVRVSTYVLSENAINVLQVKLLYFSIFIYLTLTILPFNPHQNHWLQSNSQLVTSNLIHTDTSYNQYTIMNVTFPLTIHCNHDATHDTGGLLGDHRPLSHEFSLSSGSGKHVSVEFRCNIIASKLEDFWQHLLWRGALVTSHFFNTHRYQEAERHTHYGLQPDFFIEQSTKTSLTTSVNCLQHFSSKLTDPTTRQVVGQLQRANLCPSTNTTAYFFERGIHHKLKSIPQHNLRCRSFSFERLTSRRTCQTSHKHSWAIMHATMSGTEWIC